MMMSELPYCGAAPSPGELLSRFNLDPVLIAVLGFALCLQLILNRSATPRQHAAAIVGWSIVAAALISPLCALSVALLSARIGQHMILVLIAAPLIALGTPVHQRGIPLRLRSGWPLWLAASVFFFALWFWHMPWPYEATFTSTRVYWCMHVSLFGSAIWLWIELLHQSRDHTAGAFVAAALTSFHMGLLGATLSLAGHALFRWHLTTTWAFGLSPLEDQQLGGVIMWVPGIALFLWVAIRGVARLSSSPDAARAS
jgi:putative membrane protein